MELRLNGRVLPIAQLGPDFLMLVTPIDHPPAEAEIALSIDGDERCWRVRLVDGIAASQRDTRIAPGDRAEAIEGLGRPGDRHDTRDGVTGACDATITKRPPGCSGSGIDWAS
jgi:hypothetical protein